MYIIIVSFDEFIFDKLEHFNNTNVHVYTLIHIILHDTPIHIMTLYETCNTELDQYCIPDPHLRTGTLRLVCTSLMSGVWCPMAPPSILFMDCSNHGWSFILQLRCQLMAHTDSFVLF
jgi:hypothetical protein